jgi:predicted MFS family arabinose efflux permease
MSASLGIGAALGLPIAAFVADNFNWHVLFWGSAAFGLAALALVLVLIPESRVRTGGRFDLVGAFGLAAGLVCLLLAVSKGTSWGRGQRHHHQPVRRGRLGPGRLGLLRTAH